MFLSTLINSSGKIIERYNNNYYDSKDAYELLSSPVKNIILTKESADFDEINPLAFWIGNQLFYKNEGLGYIHKYNVLQPEGANILLTNFNNNYNFNFMLNGNSIYMHEIFRNSQIQYRYFYNEPDGRIFKAIPLKSYQDLKFDFEFQDINLSKKSSYKIVLKFDRKVSPFYTVIFLKDSKYFIIQNQNTIVFFTDTLQRNTSLELLNVSGHSRINSIEIYDLSKYPIKNKTYDDYNSSNNLKKVFNFRSRNFNCRFNVKADYPSMIYLYGSLAENSNYQFNIFNDENINAKVQFSTMFRSDKSQQNEGCQYFDNIN
jgi:hypothetical protein